MHCNHCEEPIETKQKGIINCPHCNWSVIINSSYNTNKNLFEVRCKYWDDEKTIIKSNRYYYKNQLHNEQGPARVFFYEDGSKHSESYSINGKKHRENGPASINYYKNGNISSEYYYKHGKFHRENSPAVIEYSPDGSIYHEYYYLNGIKNDNNNK